MLIAPHHRLIYREGGVWHEIGSLFYLLATKIVGLYIVSSRSAESEQKKPAGLELWVVDGRREGTTLLGIII